MKILITGAEGFIGKNLREALKSSGTHDLYLYDKTSEHKMLDDCCKNADFIYHLAGVNRPERVEEFMEGNFGFTTELLSALKKHKNTCPIMMASSIQAEMDNDYGRSKKAGEDLMLRYSEETGAKVLIYRLPNVFGKWSRPNYNSVVATFCHNIAHDLPITVNDPTVWMHLAYIDDVVAELIRGLTGEETVSGTYCEIPVVHKVRLGAIAEQLHSFRQSRENRLLPDFGDGFTKKLYSTYLSFLPEDEFSYDLKMNVDHRGSFTEFIRTPERGQVSVNISKPGITKGQHWHHTKNEKFLVVSGEGVIRFRKVGTDKVIEYHVSGDKMEVVDIPTGYTHNIENIGETDMVTVMWANEAFDPENPDTYYLEV